MVICVSVKETIMTNSPAHITKKFQTRSLFVRVWHAAQLVLTKPRPKRESPLDLMEARDDMLRDIGLLDGPDVALRRSDPLLPSERAGLFERGLPF